MFFNQCPHFDSFVLMKSFRTLQSACPTILDMFSNTSPSFPYTDDKPSKRSKVEKNTSKTKKDVPKLFNGSEAIFEPSDLRYY